MSAACPTGSDASMPPGLLRNCGPTPITSTWPRRCPPVARGFGDRWSAVKPTPLDQSPPGASGEHLSILLDFLVRLVLPAMPAELLQLQTLRGGLLVLRGRIIPVLALGALKGNDFASHCRLLLVLGRTIRPLLDRKSTRLNSSH